ncbi:MAG: hypothetical protein SynsKO_45790 [Synoicihabitans sp.]
MKFRFFDLFTSKGRERIRHQKVIGAMYRKYLDPDLVEAEIRKREAEEREQKTDRSNAKSPKE